MDWIEKLTGLSPDHGNGMLELEFFIAIVIAAVAVFWLVRKRSTRP